MPQPIDLVFDAATGLSIGQRKTQEDAVLCDMPQGQNAGLVVLADGLGGHAAGAVASQLAVSTVMAHLVAARNSSGGFNGPLPQLLRDAAEAANSAILMHSDTHGQTRGMGTTLVVLAFVPGGLHWLSVGDSPLYLLRNGQPIQLNETHSLAAQLDLLVQAGEMPAAMALQHPDRNCLTSALGTPHLPLIDCPSVPLPLVHDDILVLASDGILTLSPQTVQTLCTQDPSQDADALAALLLQKVADQRCPAQDNLSVAIIRAQSPAIRPDDLRVEVFQNPVETATRSIRASIPFRLLPELRARRAK